MGDGYQEVQEVISIHAPTRGATRSRFFVTIKVDFNPRSHERSDQDSMQSVRSRHHFNPRSHERSDKVLRV